MQPLSGWVEGGTSCLFVSARDRQIDYTLLTYCFSFPNFLSSLCIYTSRGRTCAARSRVQFAYNNPLRGMYGLSSEKQRKQPKTLE